VTSEGGTSSDELQPGNRPGCGAVFDYGDFAPMIFAQDVPWDDINTFLAILGGALLLGLAGGAYHIWKKRKGR
jgi:LPXTG-motif cell wall-anchored protein